MSEWTSHRTQISAPKLVGQERFDSADAKNVLPSLAAKPASWSRPLEFWHNPRHRVMTSLGNFGTASSPPKVSASPYLTRRRRIRHRAVKPHILALQFLQPLAHCPVRVLYSDSWTERVDFAGDENVMPKLVANPSNRTKGFEFVSVRHPCPC